MKNLVVPSRWVARKQEEYGRFCKWCVQQILFDVHNIGWLSYTLPSQLSHEVTESYYEVFVLFEPLGNGVFDLKGCLLALKENFCPHPSPMNRVINILGSECGSFPSLIPVCKMRCFFENSSSFSVVVSLYTRQPL